MHNFSFVQVKGNNTYTTVCCIVYVWWCCMYVHEGDIIKKWLQWLYLFAVIDLSGLGHLLVTKCLEIVYNNYIKIPPVHNEYIYTSIHHSILWHCRIISISFSPVSICLVNCNWYSAYTTQKDK